MGAARQRGAAGELRRQLAVRVRPIVRHQHKPLSLVQSIRPETINPTNTLNIMPAIAADSIRLAPHCRTPNKLINPEIKPLRQPQRENAHKS
jgi:hypothetical protein